MTASKKVTLAADGATATVAAATISDIFTSLLSTDTTLTGMYGFAQKAGLVVAGMSIQSKRKLDTFNPL